MDFACHPAWKESRCW